MKYHGKRSVAKRSTRSKRSTTKRSTKRSSTKRRLTTRRRPRQEDSLLSFDDLVPMAIDQLFTKRSKCIDWTVNQSPDKSSVNCEPKFYGMTSTGYNEIKLLLPIMPEDGDPSLVVYYQDTVVGKPVQRSRRNEDVTYGELLFKIWEFYNLVPVTYADLEYISVVDTMKTFADNELEKIKTDFSRLSTLHFVDFLRNHVKFDGVVHQGDNVFTVKLA